MLGALWVGNRYGSLALGAISGIGLALLVFGFGLKYRYSSYRCDIHHHSCSDLCWYHAGFRRYGLADTDSREDASQASRPYHVPTPLTTFFLTVLVGTGHVVYTLMPIICDIALKKGIRPERPCGVASVASQIGITCSPIAAAVVAFVSISNAHGFDVTIPGVLMISIPACLCGLMAAAAASYHRGLDLDKDPQLGEAEGPRSV